MTTRVVLLSWADKWTFTMALLLSFDTFGCFPPCGDPCLHLFSFKATFLFTFRYHHCCTPSRLLGPTLSPRTNAVTRNCCPLWPTFLRAGVDLNPSLRGWFSLDRPRKPRERWGHLCCFCWPMPLRHTNWPNGARAHEARTTELGAHGPMI